MELWILNLVILNVSLYGITRELRIPPLSANLGYISILLL